MPPPSHLHLRAQRSGYPHDGTASCGQVALPDADPAWNQGAIGLPAIYGGRRSKLAPQKHVLQGHKTCAVLILKNIFHTVSAAKALTPLDSLLSKTD